MNKVLLGLSAIITAVVLMVLGGVFQQMQQKKATSVAAQAMQAQPPLLESTQAAQNADTANNAEHSRETQAAALQTAEFKPSESKATVAPKVAISPEQAIALAQNARGNQGKATQVQSAPELVLYGKRTAYEVRFQEGVVYIDANTAQVLNPAPKSASIQTKADGAAHRATTERASRYEREEEDDDDDEEEEREHRSSHSDRKHKERYHD